MSKIIKTEKITQSDLPTVNASWDEITEFALSFDSQLELGTTDIYKISITKFNEESTIQELRLSLFLWQRFWNSRLSEIDTEGLSNLRKIIELIRLKTNNFNLS